MRSAQDVDNSGATAPATDQATAPKAKAPFLRYIEELLSPSSLQRLNNSVPVLEVELDALVKRQAMIDTAADEAATDKTTGEKGTDSQATGATAEPARTTDKNESADGSVGRLAPVPWAASARTLLAKTQEALNDRDADRGWRYFKAADRYMLYGLKQVDAAALVSRVQLVVNEATDSTKALPAWRIASVKDYLLDESGAVIQPVNVDRLVDAKRILDDHQDNVYQRLALLKKRLSLVSSLGLLFLVIWLVAAPPVPVSLSTDDPLAALVRDARAFWSLAIFAGILGGLLSAFTSAISSDFKKSNIPAELATQAITYSRLVVAALSPIAVIWFLGSGIITFPQLNNAFLIAVCIVAGFTDRFLLKAIETLAQPK